jgi:hypothetical protein
VEFAPVCQGYKDVEDKGVDAKDEDAKERRGDERQYGKGLAAA